MPKYRNQTNSPIVSFEGTTSRCIQKGEEVESAYFLDIFGLTKIDDAPYYNPVILSQTITANTTIDVTANSCCININAYNNASVSVYMNDISNTPPLILTNKNVTLNNFNQIKKLIINFNSAGKVDVNITSTSSNIIFK